MQIDWEISWLYRTSRSKIEVFDSMLTYRRWLHWRDNLHRCALVVSVLLDACVTCSFCISFSFVMSCTRIWSWCRHLRFDKEIMKNIWKTSSLACRYFERSTLSRRTDALIRLTSKRNSQFFKMKKPGQRTFASSPRMRLRLRPCARAS